jgi:pimeloyl-ACP methyl ester carboxylesterase
MTTRRTLLKDSAKAIACGLTGLAQVKAQPVPASTIATPVLNIGYEDSGNRQGFPIILLHGFPDDARAWDGVAPPLTKAGYRVLVPYLRGYGPTRFRDPAAPRMAEQAAIGQDLIDFADALGFKRFAVGGFDWGARAASVAAALHPDRVRAAVIVGGYLRLKRNGNSGTSGISTPSAGGPALPPIARVCAGCCGTCGHPAGASPMKLSTAPQFRLTTQILWTW